MTRIVNSATISGETLHYERHLICHHRRDCHTNSHTGTQSNVDTNGGDSVKDSSPHGGKKWNRGENALHHFDWIGRSTPCFAVRGNNITVLDRPIDFYEKLKVLSEGARKRIVLGSLYLGTGPLEHELVQCIYRANARSEAEGGDLRVKVLLDYTRGSRGDSNSRTMLLDLVRRFGERVSVALYHTPDLKGIRKLLLPERFNETIGLSHLKVYLFDDTLIMSGANLSDSYFTNRQDRYILIGSCSEMCDYFEQLVTVVSAMSFQLRPDNTVFLSPELGDAHPFAGSLRSSLYRSLMHRNVQEIITLPSNNASSKCLSSTDPAYPWLLPRANTLKHCVDQRGNVLETDTLVYPLVQMGPFGISQDEKVTRALFQHAPSDTTLYLASGYFNLTDHYIDCIINECRAKFQILTAAPQANGFYGSRGISGAIPDAYTYIAKQFNAAVKRARQQGRITLYEYMRPGWTVHSKGLWYYLAGQDRPSLTMIGSPNFGYRSVFRDLEVQLVFVTENKSLQNQLHEERMRLYDCSTAVTDKTFILRERRVPLWVTIATPFIKNYF